MAFVTVPAGMVLITAGVAGLRLLARDGPLGFGDAGSVTIRPQQRLRPAPRSPQSPSTAFIISRLFRIWRRRYAVGAQPSTSLRKLPNVVPMFTTDIVAPRKRGSRAIVRVLAPCSCQSPPLAKAGGQALGARFRGHDEISGLILGILIRVRTASEAAEPPTAPGRQMVKSAAGATRRFGSGRNLPSSTPTSSSIRPFKVAFRAIIRSALALPSCAKLRASCGSSRWSYTSRSFFATSSS
jgi:hypothetical protein